MSDSTSYCLVELLSFVNAKNISIVQMLKSSREVNSDLVQETIRILLYSAFQEPGV